MIATRIARNRRDPSLMRRARTEYSPATDRSTRVNITSSKSDLGDVMLTLVERSVAGEYSVRARLMSDGSLRFLAILVAIMQAPTIEAPPEPMASQDAVGQTTVVVEELENGLHAS